MPGTSWPTPLRLLTTDTGLAPGDLPRIPFSTAPVAALAIEVARLRIGLSIANGDTEKLRGLLLARCASLGTSSCPAGPARGDAETGLACSPSESAVAEMRLKRSGVSTVVGVLERLEPSEELLGRRPGPLTMRDDADDDEGGVP